MKDGSTELAKLTAEAEQLIKEARAEVSAMVNKQKNEKQSELDKIYAGGYRTDGSSCVCGAPSSPCVVGCGRCA